MCNLFPFTDTCAALNCQHICVNAGSGPKCLCSEGFELDNTTNACIGIYIQNLDRQRHNISVVVESERFTVKT